MGCRYIRPTIIFFFLSKLISVKIAWCPPWCQPPLPPSNISPLLLPHSKVSPLIENITCPPSTLFLKQKFLFLDLLISFIKPLKTSDFSKHVSLALARWYYYWKHSQRYHNKVNHKHKSFCTSYIRVNSVKRDSQTCITYVIRTTRILNCVKKSSYSKY